MSSKHARTSFVTLTLALALGACSPAAGGTGSPAPSNVAVGTLTATIIPAATPTSAPTASTEPTSGGGGGGGTSPTPGAIDPCTLLTVAEASAIIGTKLSAGVSQELNPDRACTFRSGLTEVRLILAPAAPDAKTAQAYWDAERSQVPAGLPVTDLTDFDRAAYASGEAAGVSISALFVIQGNYFFDLFCAYPACSQGASVGGAQHIVGRLP